MQRRWRPRRDIRKFNNGNARNVWKQPKANIQSLSVPKFDWIKLNAEEFFKEQLELFDSEDEMRMWMYEMEKLARDERIERRMERELFHIECKSCGILRPDKEDRCPCGYVKDLDKFSRNTFQGSHK